MAPADISKEEGVALQHANHLPYLLSPSLSGLPAKVHPSPVNLASSELATLGKGSTFQMEVATRAEFRKSAPSGHLTVHS